MNNVGGSKGQTSRFVGSVQHEEEWKIYWNILDRTNVTKSTKWLDIRGNHGENDNLPSKMSMIVIDRRIYGSQSRFTEKFLSVRSYFVKENSFNGISFEGSILIKELIIMDHMHIQ